jgi:hypothetical protein
MARPSVGPAARANAASPCVLGLEPIGPGGQQVPQRLTRMAARQMELDPVQLAADPPTDLEELEPQGRELRLREQRLTHPTSNRVQQPVGGNRQQEPELIGPEPMIAQPIGEAAGLEVLDAGLGTISPLDVPGVHRLRRLLSGGDDEPGIWSFLQGFGFIDDPPLGLPGAGGLLPLGDQSDRLARVRALLLRLGQERSRHGLQPAIAAEPDAVGDPVLLTVGVNRWESKAAIRP